jgi:hypothetical protein
MPKLMISAVLLFDNDSALYNGIIPTLQKARLCYHVGPWLRALPRHAAVPCLTGWLNTLIPFLVDKAINSEQHCSTVREDKEEHPVVVPAKAGTQGLNLTRFRLALE